MFGEDSGGVETMCVTVEAILASGQVRLGPYDVLLDNQSTVNMFKNSSFLSNIRPARDAMIVNGIGGTLPANEVGDMAHFGVVRYCKDALANVLSFADLRSRPGFRVQYSEIDDFFCVTTPDRYSFKFSRKGKLYMCNMSKLCNDAVACVSTVEHNARYFTKREVDKADEAITVQARAGFPSSKNLVKMVDGMIQNVPVTKHDVHRAVRIHGPNVACLKGKTKWMKSQPIKVEFLPVSVTVLSMFVDLMFVDGDPYLLSVTKPLELLMCNHLGGSKSEAAVWSALTKQFAQYKSRGFQVKTLLSDGEGAIVKLRTAIENQGIVVNPAGPQQHVPEIENRVRQVKERLRTHLSNIPFELAATLMVWLVSFCIRSINLQPSSLRTDPSSPFELFFGRKVDYKRDLRVAFGDYVQCHTPPTGYSSNSMKPRTAGAIALLPTANLQGSVKFLSLSTKAIITRDKWTPLPMPPEVITELNVFAASQKRKVSKDPLVSVGKAFATDIPPAVPDILDPVLANVPVHEVHDDMPHGPPDPTPPSVSPDSTKVVADAESLLPSVDHRGASSNEATASDNRGATDAVVGPSGPPQVGGPSGPTQVGGLSGPPHPIMSEPRRSMRLRDRERTWRDGPWNAQYNFHITVNKALRKFGKKALRAMAQELGQMLDLKVWRPVNVNKLGREALKGVIRSSMFLKEKFLSTGEFEKLKARLVAGGHMQDKSLYDDISSPTVATTAVFMIAAIAAKEGRTVATLDIKAAYLNADMVGRKVYMKLDPVMASILSKLAPQYIPYLLPDGSLIVVLDKALYGCVEAAKLWFDNLAATLEKGGFVKNPMDPCVFNLGEGADQCTIVVHVDDLMITAKDPSVVENAIKMLSDAYKGVSCNRGVKHSYLGMTFDFSLSGKVKISMEGFIKSVLSLYEVTGTAATPATEHLFDVRQSPALSEEDRTEFRSRVAKLLYLAKRVRPEMLPATVFLATRVQCATDDDMNKLNRLLRYLNGAPDLGVVLSADDDIAGGVYAYIDASYGVHADAKSHTGTVITIGKGPVFVKSTKQKVVSKSSTEAELIGVSDGSSQVLWTREFLIAQGYEVRAATLYQDNKSTIHLCEKGRSTSDRTRHIKIRYFFVKDKIDNGELKIVYKPTGDMVADILTKPLQGEAFRKMRAELLNWG